MDTRQLMKAAREIAVKHKQRAVIIIVLDDTAMLAEGWSPTGIEQKITDRLRDHAGEAVLQALSDQAKAMRSTTGKQGKLKKV